LPLPYRSTRAGAALFHPPTRHAPKIAPRIFGLCRRAERTSSYKRHARRTQELTVVHITGAATMAQIKELVNSNIKYDLSARMKQAGTKQ